MVYGRVVKSIDVNESIIKLINGFELHAQLDGLYGGVNFKDRISTYPNEINRFIDKYLDIKEIKQNSVEGQNIKEKLS